MIRLFDSFGPGTDKALRFDSSVRWMLFLPGFHGSRVKQHKVQKLPRLIDSPLQRLDKLLRILKKSHGNG